MKIFNFFRRKKATTVRNAYMTPSSKIIGNKKKTYRVKCLLNYDGVAKAKINLVIEAYSSKQAEMLIKDKIEVHPILVNKIK